ncbi:MAG: DUF4271 domain-containing protein [Gemmatimonadaceae bacterium]|nr:DUF4271 domain-containing protein [Chitinophagaceae bacterium]
MIPFLRLPLLLCFFLVAFGAKGQDSISLPAAPQLQTPVAPVVYTYSFKPSGDSLKGIEKIRLKGGWNYHMVLSQNPYFRFFDTPTIRITQERPDNGKESLFYLFAGLLFFFAVIKISFGKYLNNLLALVFRVSLKQKQIREQLIQTPFPSLLLNLFFVLVAGIYVVFLLQYHNKATGVGFWWLWLYCILFIGAMYLVKFLILKFTGWVFNMREGADTYLFIVFLVNKLLGIFLLPLLVIMAFSPPSWWAVLVTLSYVLVGGFFLYRYLASFGPVRREVKVSQFHFFLYLCAFEIAPLILIYKVLVSFL